MNVAIGLAELFTYWILLYVMAGARAIGLWLRLYEWADRMVREFEERGQ